MRDLRAPYSQSAYLISQSLPFTIHRLALCTRTDTARYNCECLTRLFTATDTRRDRRAGLGALDKCNTALALARHETLPTTSERPSSHLRRERHPNDQIPTAPHRRISHTSPNVDCEQSHTHIAEPPWWERASSRSRHTRAGEGGGAIVRSLPAKSARMLALAHRSSPRSTRVRIS